MCPDDTERDCPSSDADRIETRPSRSGGHEGTGLYPETNDGLPFSAWDDPETEPVERAFEPPIGGEEATATDSHGESVARDPPAKTHHNSSQRLRELRDFLTESAEYLDDIQDSIDGFRDTPSTYVSELQDRVGDVRNRRENIEERLPEEADYLDHVETSLRDLRERLEELETAIDALREHLQDPPDDASSERIDRIHETVDRLQTRLDILWDRPSRSNDVALSPPGSRDVSRRAAMMAVSTVLASVVTRFVFDGDNVTVSTVVFGYGGEAVEARGLIVPGPSDQHQGYGEQGYGGVPEKTN